MLGTAAAAAGMGSNQQVHYNSVKRDSNAAVGAPGMLGEGRALATAIRGVIKQAELLEIIIF